MSASTRQSWCWKWCQVFTLKKLWKKYFGYRKTPAKVRHLVTTRDLIGLKNISILTQVWNVCPNIIQYYRAVASGGEGGLGGALAHPQFLAEQLILSQPGGRLCPPQYYEPPGFSDLAKSMKNYLQAFSWIFLDRIKRTGCNKRTGWSKTFI